MSLQKKEQTKCQETKKECLLCTIVKYFSRRLLNNTPRRARLFTPLLPTCIMEGKEIGNLSTKIIHNPLIRIYHYIRSQRLPMMLWIWLVLHDSWVRKARYIHIYKHIRHLFLLTSQNIEKVGVTGYCIGTKVNNLMLLRHVSLPVCSS
jgi:hypothetical protein